MGIGGVLAMGCTIGQAVTGSSTLSIGSFIVFFSILLGSAVTMKTRYYLLYYEGEANLLKRLLQHLLTLDLCPNRSEDWIKFRMSCKHVLNYSIIPSLSINSFLPSNDWVFIFWTHPS